MGKWQEVRVWEPDALGDPHSVPDKAGRVRRMFDAIAPTYERVNAVASAGRDAAWRRRAVAAAHVGPQDRVLDVACGTGDLARAFAGHRPAPAVVVGVDFARRMLDEAIRRPKDGIAWCLADALRLPFPAGAFTVLSCAFGVRNFQDLDRGLSEMYRVLAPGGRVVILEFAMPTNGLARRVYGLYVARVLPWLAAGVSRERVGAYRYLPASVVSFCEPRTVCQKLRRAGFAAVTLSSLSFGIVSLYVARKA